MTKGPPLKRRLSIYSYLLAPFPCNLCLLIGFMDEVSMETGIEAKHGFGFNNMDFLYPLG